MVNFGLFRKWLITNLDIEKRLQLSVVHYLISLMMPARKHSITEAAKNFKTDKSNFSRMLRKNHQKALENLGHISRRRARKLKRKSMSLRKKGVPWEIFIIVDSTIQERSSLKAENVHRFRSNGKCVTGHRWTNIVLLINDEVVPLPPIPHYTKKYCEKHDLQYTTENKALFEYIKKLDLKEYIGDHDPSKVMFLADSGYDDKKIENSVIGKGWIFNISLKSSRSVKSERQYQLTKKSEEWKSVAELFRTYRIAKWATIHIDSNGPSKKRKKRNVYRIRQIIGFLKNVGKVQLVCSEYKKRPDGRRKYLACSALNVPARMVIVTYRLRWSVEVFHKQIKMFLGFEDVSAKHFTSVMSHVYWVYCAYNLLGLAPPGIPEKSKSFAQMQERVKEIVSTRETNRLIQLLSQFNGRQRLMEELQRSRVVSMS